MPITLQPRKESFYFPSSFRFSGHRKKSGLGQGIRMSRKYERNDKIALLYPANLLAAQTYFQLSFVFVQLRVVFGGRNSVTFRWDTCFRPIMSNSFAEILSVSYALSASRYFIRNWFRFDNFVSFFGVVHFVRLSGKNQVVFFSIFAIMWFCSQASQCPAKLTFRLCSLSQRMLAAVLCAL